jgi:hypothetical protein
MIDLLTVHRDRLATAPDVTAVAFAPAF